MSQAVGGSLSCDPNFTGCSDRDHALLQSAVQANDDSTRLYCVGDGIVAASEPLSDDPSPAWTSCNSWHVDPVRTYSQPANDQLAVNASHYRRYRHSCSTEACLEEAW